MDCPHEHVDHDRFDYCEDCGAVKRHQIPGYPPEEWHSCPACDLRSQNLPAASIGVEPEWICGSCRLPIVGRQEFRELRQARAILRFHKRCEGRKFDNLGIDGTR